MVSSDFLRQIDGYGLTTAKILYRLPDFPAILQSYVWQHYDLAPEFPELRRFLDFWQEKLEGPLHSVQVGHKRLIGPNEWRAFDADYMLH
ncbi:Usg protein, probable subunit of phosphoribosylanthranilate isomerase [Hartmannibacter diazotrophicus]|uniref:Usg protein, probable subunit of phosphoribosylanthranilate isomerase n=1 Tax=Hartmannibacter diazotrophicus TaxID=1482074 RepID=A0A2C9D784_9HYPH|nr:usg protein [Hartmannibacter diazotrophicus]SON56103.1 Usg protein, probable subunit of phosphoribosylanthranilate isomerase [Hartmannibacter diazotrophicus]